MIDHIVRFFKSSKASFFIFGPRGTGKTSWTLKHFPEALRIDLLALDIERLYEAEPERLINTIEANPDKKVILIDEIQKNPKLLEVVHLLIERDKTLQFILTGSSARKLRQQGVNLLAGRAIEKHMHPFLAAEVGSDLFSLSKALNIGMLPLAWGHAEPEAALSTYISLYIKEEVQLEGFTRNIGAFSRFLEVMSFSHGEELNITNIANDAQIKRKTAENYIKILEDILLAFKIEVFTKRAQRSLTAHPKFYFFDAGVYNRIRPQHILDKDTEIQSQALEGLVAQHLRAWCDYSEGDHKLYFWRTRTGHEVDFIVYGKKGLFAIEVKNKKTINNTTMFRALNTFKEDYPVAQTVLLYRGAERLKIGETLVIPCEEFLLGLEPNKDLWH